MALREIKERARRDLHKAMQVPAYYYAPKTAVPLSVNIRVHSKYEALGDVKGTSFGYAERRETIPFLIFLREECEPKQGGVVIVSADEGYTLGVLDPRDTITRKVAVTEMSREQVAKYIAPEQGMVLGGDMSIPAMYAGPLAGELPSLESHGEGFMFNMVDGSLVAPLPIGG